MLRRERNYEKQNTNFGHLFSVKCLMQHIALKEKRILI